MSSTEVESINSVHILGRVGAPGVEKILPSGDALVEFRIVVDRAKPRSKKREVDVLEIAVWSARLRRRALALQEGQIVEVFGELRRRFWKGSAGVASRWQVEASELTRR
ncbi:MAG: single-stranded DNA-binding protein [Actinomycetes bacterium]